MSVNDYRREVCLNTTLKQKLNTITHGISMSMCHVIPSSMLALTHLTLHTSHSSAAFELLLALRLLLLALRLSKVLPIDLPVATVIQPIEDQ